MLSIDDFLKSREITDILSNLNSKVSAKQYSDLIDDQGHQYVDLVQEGGGVLGIALLGYTYIMEEMGIRFFSLGGTSAGAINTLLLVGCGKIDKKKSEQIIQYLIEKILFDFVDGQLVTYKLIRSFLNSSSLIAKVNVGQHNWLNFSIKDDAKIDLFVQGAIAAKNFLIKFDWNGYKAIREKLLTAN